MTVPSISLSPPPILVSIRSLSAAIRAIPFALAAKVEEMMKGKPLSYEFTQSDLLELIETKRALNRRMVKQVILISKNTVPEAWRITASLRSPETLPCFDYAFLQIRDFRPLLTEYEVEDLPRLLKEWGYTFPDTPKAGDLVLFLDSNKTPVHMGVYREGHLIESKWGNEIGEAYLHQLEDAPETYGTLIVYCRAPKNLAEIMSALEKKLEDSSSSGEE